MNIAYYIHKVKLADATVCTLNKRLHGEIMLDTGANYVDVQMSYIRILLIIFTFAKKKRLLFGIILILFAEHAIFLTHCIIFTKIMNYYRTVLQTEPKLGP